MPEIAISSSKPRVLSGMRPTGKLHLGNYMGALANWVKLQDEYECYFFIADVHALTTDYADTSKIAPNTLEVALDFLAAGLDPARLELEISEATIMRNLPEVASQIRTLAALGIHFSVDDFGTAYSSLSHLHELPLSTLKIDRSFVRGLGDDNGSLDIVRAILELARSLRLKVIAEGVETEEQLSSLRQLGCDYMQGFLFSKPVDAEAAKEFYRQSCNGDAISLAFAGPRSIHVAGMGRRAASLDAEHL